jgi:hypothetical protein
MNEVGAEPLSVMAEPDTPSMASVQSGPGWKGLAKNSKRKEDLNR